MMADDADILQCLLENLHSPTLLNEHINCRQALLEVQYFLSRDFSYDKKFRHACKDEARELCLAEDMSAISEEEDLIMPLSLIINCLYAHAHPFEDNAENAAGKRLSHGCTAQVHRVMKERSMEVGLNDDLDRDCKAALGEYCSDSVDQGVEFLCLQEHYDEMRETEKHLTCLDSIYELTKIASEELDLEQVLFQACEPMVQKFCSEGNGSILIIHVLLRCKLQGAFFVKSMCGLCSISVQFVYLCSIYVPFLFHLCSIYVKIL